MKYLVNFAVLCAKIIEHRSSHGPYHSRFAFTVHVLCRKKEDEKSDVEKVDKKLPGRSIEWSLVDESGVQYLAAEGENNRNPKDAASWFFKHHNVVKEILRKFCYVGKVCQTD